MPGLLQRATGLTGYNAGIDGQDFLYAELLHHRLRQRHRAKVVLLHLDASSLHDTTDEVRRLQQFARWVDDDAYVREVLSRRGPYETLKLWSWAYRYNGIALPILRNSLLQRDSAPADGFVPLDGKLLAQSTDPPPQSTQPTAAHATFSISPTRLADLRLLISRCREDGTRLVVFTSPTLLTTRPERDAWQAALQIELRNHPEVAFLALDCYAPSNPFLDELGLFRDNGHLNRQGAVLYSEWLGRELATVLATPST
jgi:hypothetical protein